MSLQAELALDLVITLYIEADKKSGWLSKGTLISTHEKRGVARGRSEHAIELLKRLKMIDNKADDQEKLKLSLHGIHWFEANFSLTNRNPYEFEGRICRKVVLQGPDGIKTKSNTAKNGLNWSKWGALAGIAALPLTIVLWWFT